MKQVIYRMEVLNDTSNEKVEIDTYLLAAGSDYRAYEALRILIKNAQINDVILFEYVERIPQILLGDHYDDYKTLPLKNIKSIKCSVRDPRSCLKELILNQSKFKGRKISMDISCLTKPYFFYLLKLFKEKFQIQAVNIYYTEPLSYIFSSGIFDYHSTSGPLSVLEIPGFPGLEERGDKRLFVVLLGFDGELSREITEDVSPHETYAINGFPGYAPKFKDISLIANERLTSDSDVLIRYARANNPFEVYNVLEAIKTENISTFINIAPLGTKPMALGACIFALQHPKARVIYPFPQSYERVTTDGCSSSWKYEIPL